MSPNPPLKLTNTQLFQSIFEEKLREGMVIAFEPKFVFPGKGVVGLARLTLTDQTLIRI